MIRALPKNGIRLVWIIIGSLLVSEVIVWFARPSFVVAVGAPMLESTESLKMGLSERLGFLLPKKYRQFHKDLIEGYSIEVWSAPGESQKIVSVCDASGHCIEDLLGQTRFYNGDSGRMLRVSGKTNDLDGLKLEIKRPIVTRKEGLLFSEEVTRYDTKWLGGVFRLIDDDWPSRVKIVVGLDGGRKLTTTFTTD